MGILSGKMREKLGWATGDRREEAKGQLQQLPDSPDEGTDDASVARAVDEAELQVRSEHGDLAPEAEPDQ